MTKGERAATVGGATVEQLGNSWIEDRDLLQNEWQAGTRGERELLHERATNMTLSQLAVDIFHHMF